MKKKKNSLKNKLSTKLMIILLSSFILIFILTSSFNSKIYDEKIYYKLYEKNGVYTYFGNESFVKEKTNELFKFFKGENLNTSFFNNKEISHLEDVSNIFKILNILQYVSIILILLILLYLFYQNMFILNLYKVWILHLLIALILIILIYNSNFENLFDKMHELFFPQGNYTFNNNSNMIQMFPLGFFQDFFKLIILDIGIKEMIFTIVGFLSLKYFLKFEKEKNNNITY